jgi:hypothetical protein
MLSMFFWAILYFWLCRHVSSSQFSAHLSSAELINKSGLWPTVLRSHLCWICFWCGECFACGLQFTALFFCLSDSSKIWVGCNKVELRERETGGVDVTNQKQQFFWDNNLDCLLIEMVNVTCAGAHGDRVQQIHMQSYHSGIFGF